MKKKLVVFAMATVKIIAVTTFILVHLFYANLRINVAHPTAAKVYRSGITNPTPVTHLAVMQPRISQQVENIRNMNNCLKDWSAIL